MNGYDISILIFVLILASGLFRNVFKHPKPDKTTCLVDGIGQTGIAVTLLLMGFWLSAGANFLAAASWWIMLFQARETGEQK